MEKIKYSTKEIEEIATVIWKDTIAGSTKKDWDLFSRHMDDELKTDELRRDIEKQWESNNVLTTLSESFELIEILEREGSILVLWKQGSTEFNGELLGLLDLRYIGGKLKAAGANII